MKNYQNQEILESEAERVLVIVNNQVLVPFTIDTLLDNIKVANKPMDDYWDIRISKVSSKDLESWDDSKFTDGDNNGKSLLVKMNPWSIEELAIISCFVV